MKAHIFFVEACYDGWTSERPAVELETRACAQGRVHLVSTVEAITFADQTAYVLNRRPTRFVKCDGSCQPSEMLEMLSNVLTYWPEDNPELALEEVRRQAREVSGKELAAGRLFYRTVSGRTSTQTYCTGNVHVAVHEAWGSSCGPADVKLERCSLHPCRPVEFRLPRRIARRLRNEPIAPY